MLTLARIETTIEEKQPVSFIMLTPNNTLKAPILSALPSAANFIYFIPTTNIYFCYYNRLGITLIVYDSPFKNIDTGRQ